MAELQSPTVEIAPVIITSNSSEDQSHDDIGETANSPSDNGDGELGGSSLDENASSLNSEIVAIAEIEAERDITLAAIHSDVERERIAVEGERIEAIVESNEDLELCRREIANLTERVEALSLLIQPPVSEEVIAELLETAPELNLTEPSIAVPIVETQMELSEENEDEKPEAEIPSRVRKFIAI